jgi:hypothetical protein
MAEPIDVRERRELCDLLIQLGPDAPTLCEGWTTADLAAHLVLREHFKKWPDERLAAEKAKGLPVLVERLRGGAPYFPWRIPRVRTVMNASSTSSTTRTSGGPTALTGARIVPTWK